jgi:metallo-beta-lactamase family protein
LQLQFLGGARNVTGSQHLLEAGGARILLDCGLFQGRRSEAISRNTTFAFDPASIDAVIVSHAHMDHSGKLPMLAKGGFRGTIYCTHATRDLCGLMLRDSANIQLKDAEYLNRHLRDGEPRIQPLYDTEDVQRVLQHFVGIPYGKSFQPVPNVRVTFGDAGHTWLRDNAHGDLRERRKENPRVHRGRWSA